MRLVEGRDFTSQKELRAAHETQPARVLSAMEWELSGLLSGIVRDLELARWCGELPCGGDHGSQTWWRVSLWVAFWRAHERGLSLNEAR